jgi:hypothetical protein
VVKRLLLDRVDGEATGTTVGSEDDPVFLPSPHETEAPLALAQPAGSRADVALNAAIGEIVPVPCYEALLEQIDSSVADAEPVAVEPTVTRRIHPASGSVTSYSPG